MSTKFVLFFQLIVEAAVRVKPYVAKDASITLKVTALDENDKELFTPEELTFKVSQMVLRGTLI